MRRLARTAMSAAAILAITAAHASAAPAACSDPPAALSKLTTATTPAPVPDQPILENGDTERTMADWRGRALVLNFWATWCAPCIAEMPALDALKADIADDGIDVLTVSNDFGGAEVVRRWYEANDIEHLPVLNDQRGRLARAFKVPGLPTTILIDREGREVARVVGPAEWEDPSVAAYLRACLAPES